ncbi:oxidoreductase [Phytohabitans sp. ZYX-F-186]|uniref:Oxidoreductase n=1 Tax=Phytohabitans maris TaxID=3071409 RepID=A0ABU0ZCS7_9ACTN|nr:oxidoreductase [Phytohabitans sp. ZYX-F-186]MDQ7904874.1 oxidoreductase [Phytohabitans sp. ZYX-F-186]
MREAAALTAIAVLDSMFAGFRSSLGRTGLIRHRHRDVLAHLRGLALSALLLAPVAAVALVDVALRGPRLAIYLAAGRAMLLVYLPFAAVVLLALAAYLVPHWQHRFLAAVVVLGPGTLARPLVALAGVAAAGWASRDALATTLALGAVCAALAVEPWAERRWYGRTGPPGGAVRRILGRCALPDSPGVSPPRSRR